VAALSDIAFAFAQLDRTGDEAIYQSQQPALKYENVLAAAQDRLSDNYKDSRLVLADMNRAVLNAALDNYPPAASTQGSTN
jgi:hypothetical protein